ncbi:MAG: type II toxin-antitoxin system HicB family antitoxin [Neisseriaceae bacterium]|nr:type II toxin-antitoxin system HicB family antitoxin [Neisseriaceae bacterium]
MNNIMFFGKYTARISYDEESKQFRGEFLNLKGGADFYARNLYELKQQGQISLNEYLSLCQEKGII